MKVNTGISDGNNFLSNLLTLRFPKHKYSIHVTVQCLAHFSKEVLNSCK
jgi:hypothetical protein